MPLLAPQAKASLAALEAVAKQLGVALAVSICLPPWGDAAAGLPKLEAAAARLAVPVCPRGPVNFTCQVPSWEGFPDRPV